MKLDNQKLIYVHKVGNNVKGEGIYEFIFSANPDKMDSDDMEALNWHVLPAKDNVQYPNKQFYDLVVSLTTDQFSLICLEELNDRKYEDGYYGIHALAYDDLEFTNDYGIEYDDVLVFHYRDSFKSIEDKLYQREVVFDPKKQEFVHAGNIKIKKDKLERIDF